MILFTQSGNALRALLHSKIAPQSSLHEQQKAAGWWPASQCSLLYILSLGERRIQGTSVRGNLKCMRPDGISYRERRAAQRTSQVLQLSKNGQAGLQNVAEPRHSSEQDRMT
jgi:hypothetical protein